MKNITVYHYDAFTDVQGMGNPAGIVLNGDGLTEAEMQAIAQKVGFNETAFPLKSEVADVRVLVQVDKDEDSYHVYVTGNVVYVTQFDVTID